MEFRLRFPGMLSSFLPSLPHPKLALFFVFLSLNTNQINTKNHVLFWFRINNTLHNKVFAPQFKDDSPICQKGLMLGPVTTKLHTYIQNISATKHVRQCSCVLELHCGLCNKTQILKFSMKLPVFFLSPHLTWIGQGPASQNLSFKWCKPMALLQHQVLVRPRWRLKDTIIIII